MKIEIIGYADTENNEKVMAPRNAALQGTVNMSLAEPAIIRSTSSARGYLELRVKPKSLLSSVRIQASVSQNQFYDYWDTRFQYPRYENLRLEVYLGRTKPGTNFTADKENLFLHANVHHLEFNERNQEGGWQTIENFIDETFPFLEFTDKLFVSIVGRYTYGTSELVVTSETVKLFSLTFDETPIGCAGVQIRSMDERLVSNTDNKVLEYPILFLGREPVREDAQAYKEVLVFQDKATTIRVIPQPILLNEENNYAANAAVESNGHWMLYSYDKGKLLCALDSGLPITGGAGNDILYLTKPNTFLTYGLYNLTLLFATDTSDEPYIVPVILDYAVPLSVNGETRILNLHLDEGTRCVRLDIVRDRYWKVLGFPLDHLTMGVMEGVRDTTTFLCMSESYSELGVKTFSFIVQSGVKRVIINVTVKVDNYFTAYKKYVLLEPSNAYTQTLFIKRYNYDDYTWTAPAGHEITQEREVSKPEEIKEPEEPEETIYDLITIKYIGENRTVQAGGLSTSVEFKTTKDNSSVRVDIYRNIERNFEIGGTDNRPDRNNTPWSYTKTTCVSAHTKTGEPHKYLPLSVSQTVSTNISVYANQALTFSGETISMVSGSLTYASVRAGQMIGFTSSSIWLHAVYTLTFTFPEYRRYVHHSAGTGVTLSGTGSLEPKLDIPIEFEVRYPHFFKINHAYLQWDNSWTQHHWLLTNPDAVISHGDHTGQNHAPVDLLRCTKAHASYTNGDYLMKLENPPEKRQSEHAQTQETAPYYNVYNVPVQSLVPPSVVSKGFLDQHGTLNGSPNIPLSFKTVIAHKKLLRNEIIPLMASNTTEINFFDEAVASGFTVSGTMLSANYLVFNRNNSGENKVTLGATKNRLLSSNFLTKNNTASFIVAFPYARIIRSWSYTVCGDRNIVCGFLIEGWLDGMDTWEPISAVTDYSTLSANFSGTEIERDKTITGDYVTVAPRPWNKIRVTITQVQKSGGNLASRTETTNGDFTVGQFQFYEGYPVLKRVQTVMKGTRTDASQLNTRSGSVTYIALSDSVVVTSAFDGRLQPSMTLSGSGDYAVQDYLDTASGYQPGQPPNSYWEYQLVSTFVPKTRRGSQHGHRISR